VKSSALIALALSGAALIGYVSYRTLLPAPATVASPAAEADVEAAPGVEAADTLPEFTLATLTGERRSIFDWPDRALVINFWATWCAPCRREIPLLKEFQSARQDDGIQVVGIAVDKVEPVQAFAAEMEFNYPQLIGMADAMDAAASFGIDFFALPFTVFTDGSRNVLGVHTGELHAEDLDNLATALAELEAGHIDLQTARARVAGRL
jgi:thiol-disulfide isomerase/thioredoxin